MYLEHQKQKEPSHGKIPVKKLVGQGAGARLVLFDIKELCDLTSYNESELNTLGEEKRKRYSERSGRNPWERND